MSYKLKKTHSIWFTGLPSSGKTTIGKFLLKKLSNTSLPVILIDADEFKNIFFDKRKYTKTERLNSTKKFVKLCKILLRTKILIIISANHAFNDQRNFVRKKLKKKYSEIWINTPLKDCKKRDVKKLYNKAKKGLIKNLVGHDLKFEKPKKHNLKVNSKNNTLEYSGNLIISYLKNKNIIKNEH